MMPKKRKRRKAIKTPKALLEWGTVESFNAKKVLNNFKATKKSK